jgi:hypothetical protein
MLSPLQKSSEKPKSKQNEETSGKRDDCTSVAVDAGDDIFNLNSFVDKHEYSYLRVGKRKKELEAVGNKKSTTHVGVGVGGGGENKDESSRERGDEGQRRRRRSTTREKTK